MIWFIKQLMYCIISQILTAVLVKIEIFIAHTRAFKRKCVNR